MKRPAKAGFVDGQSGRRPSAPAKRRVGKRSAKPGRKNKKFPSSGNKDRRLAAAEKPDRGSGIRETEEARALLENQLNGLYWWVFNAFKMKGFIRAKALDELQRAGANGTATHSATQFRRGSLFARKTNALAESGQFH